MKQNKTKMNDDTIATIQEITLQAYEFGIYNKLQDEQDKSREEIFLIFRNWAKEFETMHEGYEWDGDWYDEIDIFLTEKLKNL